MPRLEVPAEFTGDELGRGVLKGLMSLGDDRGTRIARHLVYAASIVDDVPDLAWQHAEAARGLGARSGVVREAVGLIAYQSGRYTEALAELRTARRITGSHEHLPVLADCERGLGRPSRALDLAAAPEVAGLDRDGQVEMLIVAAGARGDLGEHEAAVATLEVAWLNARTGGPWLARLRSAYSDALREVGRIEEADRWLRAAAAADADGVTGAAARLAQMIAETETETETETEAETEAGSARPGAGQSDGPGADAPGADGPGDAPEEVPGEEPGAGPGGEGSAEADDAVGEWIDLDEDSLPDPESEAPGR
jgi:tetratricopeptide (TPR) repeat protein